MLRTQDKLRRQRRQRQARCRAIIKAQPNDRPRLTVHISAGHIRAQVINDQLGQTLASASTVGYSGTQAKASLSHKAELIGTEIGQACSKLKIKKVNFDRNGRLYHGRLEALAQAARQAGLEF